MLDLTNARSLNIKIWKFQMKSLVRSDWPCIWYGKGGGKGVQDGEHVYTRGGCMLMSAKTNTNCKVKNKLRKK